MKIRLIRKAAAAAVLLIFMSVISADASGTSETDTLPVVSAQGYCVMDADTGEILLSENGSTQFHPASITKIMTLLVAAEHCPDPDRKAAVSENALTQIGPLSSTLSPMPKPGEVFSIRDLMYGLIMRSGNECANVLAEYTSGSIDDFAELMNSRAEEAGAINTHFVNPHGLDDDEHLTTPEDMACIMKAALENDTAAAVLSAGEYTIPETNYCAVRSMTSGHPMIKGTFPYEGVYAGKSGYTIKAGSTLATAAKRGKTNLIAVVMGCQEGQSANDTAILLDCGFAEKEGRPLSGGLSVFSPCEIQADPDSFTMEWTVGTEAVRAQFCVWIEYDPEDVITRYEGQPADGKLQLKVSLADHNGKNGVYTVQAFVYDSEGNSRVNTAKIYVGDCDISPGFFNADGKTRFRKEGGALGLMWQEMDDGCYYFDWETGEMQTGWIRDSNTVFFLEPDGRLHTGWLDLDGSRYYFQAAGDMVTGIWISGGAVYEFDDNGVLKSGYTVPDLSGAS